MEICVMKESKIIIKRMRKGESIMIKGGKKIRGGGKIDKIKKNGGN
jgi:hypothetical protein